MSELECNSFLQTARAGNSLYISTICCRYFSTKDILVLVEHGPEGITYPLRISSGFDYILLKSQEKD